jgi:hypothetical protein
MISLEQLQPMNEELTLFIANAVLRVLEENHFGMLSELPESQRQFKM